jgi:predicted DNA-binding protein YlxM (UPF0122 family)
MPTAGGMRESLKKMKMNHTTKIEPRSDDEISLLYDTLKKGNDEILIDFEEAHHLLEMFQIHPETVKLFKKHSENGTFLSFKLNTLDGL